MFKVITYIFLASICFTVCEADEIRVACSDLLPNEFFEELYSFQDVSSKSLSVKKSGSLPIIEEFLSNNLDICIIAKKDYTEMRLIDEQNIRELPFAFKSIIVIVNLNNPLNELDLESLSRIYSTSETFSTNSWRDLGLLGFRASSINPLALLEENSSFSNDLFRDSVFKKSTFNNFVNYEEEDDVVNIVSKDIGAVGLLSSLPKTRSVKILSLSGGKDSLAYGPNLDNIYFGDYPLRLPFYILFKESDINNLFSLIAYLFESNISNILESNGLFPLPDAVSNKMILDLESELE